jgi:hypothetical protein
VNDLPSIGPHPHEEGEPGLHAYLEGYQRSSEVERVANDLIREQVGLAWLGQYGLAYLLHHTDPPEEGAKPCTWARARLVPKWAQALTDGSVAAIVVNAPVWRQIPDEARQPLLLHALLHLGANEKTGALVLQDHDVAEFGQVARAYGAWLPSLRAFGEQLTLGMGPKRG